MRQEDTRKSSLGQESSFKIRIILRLVKTMRDLTGFAPMLVYFERLFQYGTGERQISEKTLQAIHSSDLGYIRVVKSQEQ